MYIVSNEFKNFYYFERYSRAIGFNKVSKVKARCCLGPDGNRNYRCLVRSPSTPPPNIRCQNSTMSPADVWMLLSWLSLATLIMTTKTMMMIMGIRGERWNEERWNYTNTATVYIKYYPKDDCHNFNLSMLWPVSTCLQDISNWALQH